MKRARDECLQPFRFDFGSEKEASEPLIDSPGDVPSDGLYALVLEDQGSLVQGDIVKIDFASSSHFGITVLKDSHSHYIAPQSLRLLHRDVTCNAQHFDSVCWERKPWISAPMSVGHEVRFLVSPFSSQFFIEQVFIPEGIFVVHATGERVQDIKKEMFGFDVERMLGDASRVIVWMKEKETSRLRYLDLGPGGNCSEMAFSCYLSGHSLYFNPSIEFQKKWISSVLEDLGLFPKPGEFGGDVEIFAVKGKHKTPWHFDAQENFTIQLQGCKMWTIKKSSIKNPITNFHPSSSNREGNLRDLSAHAGYGCDRLCSPPENDEDAEIIYMRPGSVLYVPGGYWHKVESIDGDSLSMNLSIDSCRWTDLICNVLTPLAWRNDPNCRARVRESGRKEFLKEIASHLRAMANVIDQVSSEDVYSVLHREEAPAVTDLRAVELHINGSTRFRRNPLVWVFEDLKKKGNFHVSGAFSASNSQPEIQSSFKLSMGEAYDILLQLISISPAERIKISDICPRISEEILGLFQHLADFGFLLIIP